MNKILLSLSIIFYSNSFAQVSGEAYFTKNDFTSNNITYVPGTDTVFFTIIDPDKNISNSSIDTVHIFIKSTLETTEEFIAYEITNNSSIFRGFVLIDTSGIAANDGLLTANKPDTLYLEYYDQMGGFGGPEIIKDSIYFWIYTGFLLFNPNNPDYLDIHLKKEDNPHFILGKWSEVCVWVTIEAGVIIKFLQNAEFELYSSALYCDGTDVDPIIFTSASQSPAPGDWKGLSLSSSVLTGIANGSASYCIIEYAQYGCRPSPVWQLPYGIYLSNSVVRHCSEVGIISNSVSLNNTIVKNNKLGIQCLDDSYGGSSSFINSEIKECEIGVFILSYGQVNIIQSCISNNSVEGIKTNSLFYPEPETRIIKINNSFIDSSSLFTIRNQAPHPIDARFNYWGTFTTLEINQGNNPKDLTYIYDFYDDPSIGFVNYGSWKNALQDIYPIPEQVSPINNVNINTLTFYLRWNHIDYSCQYEVQLAQDSLFQNIIFSDSTIINDKALISGIQPGVYFWRVKSKNSFGKGNWSNYASFNYVGPSAIENDNTTLPEFSLSQNYPNPFNNSTTIGYEIPVASYVQIKVFDVLGNEILSLVNEHLPAGKYNIDYNSDKLPSGVYFYTLISNNRVETKKLVLLK